MRPLILLIFLSSIIFNSCSISVAKTAATNDSNKKTYPLVHIVYFKVKEEADKQQLIAEIQKIEAISVLKNLEIGVFKPLGDSRAMSQYEITVQMRFASETDYHLYQKHPLHLALKKNAGPYLAGPPVTYDYITQ